MSITTYIHTDISEIEGVNSFVIDVKLSGDVLAETELPETTIGFYLHFGVNRVVLKKMPVYPACCLGDDIFGDCEIILTSNFEKQGRYNKGGIT